MPNRNVIPGLLTSVFTCVAVLLSAGTISAAELPATGIVEPFLDVTLSASVPGIIVKRDVQEGDFVEQGKVLLELDSALERLEVERRKLVSEQKRTDFEATEKLFKNTKGVSKEELDKKESEYRIAAVEHEIALEQKARRQLIAPLSGTVAEIILEVGEACQPYQALMRVVDARRCYLVAHIEAARAAGLNEHQEVHLELSTGDRSVQVTGKVFFISPVVDPASGLQKVKVLFDNEKTGIRPGGAGTIVLK